MGFTEEAEHYRRLWARLYPRPRIGTLPGRLLETFPGANSIVVDAICYQPFEALGGKYLADVLPFGAKEQQFTEEVAQRLAAGTDPGIVPERFLIGAARVALDNGLARPGVVARNFYTELSRR
jgi:hypothetical protein